MKRFAYSVPGVHPGVGSPDGGIVLHVEYCRNHQQQEVREH